MIHVKVQSTGITEILGIEVHELHVYILYVIIMHVHVGVYMYV